MGRIAASVLLASAMLLVAAAAASGAISNRRISSDPYTNTSSQHATQVEPDTFARNSTVVSTFQTGRFFDGGSSNIGWATSTDDGSTWRSGFLPGITVYQGGSYARVSDPSVAYDPRHSTWMIASLALVTSGSSVTGRAVVVNRSTDGGLTWGSPVTVASVPGRSLDKSWIVCDDNSSSPFYGRCYVEWDDNADGNRIKMSRSLDGGLTWGAALQTVGNATGLGGQPLTMKNGTVIVPIANANVTAIRAFRSTDGGGSWSSPVTISSVTDHAVAGGLRTEPLPTAEIDGAGRVYVMWQDCRFRAGCSSNDIVWSSSIGGSTWTAVKRVPIDPVDGTADHFIPGVGVDRATSGSGGHIALTYYFYPSASCTSSTCRLYEGYMSSTNGGSTWSSRNQLGGAMSLSSLANTNQGRMVGDYQSISFTSRPRAVPVFALAKAPSGGVFDEAMYSSSSGLAAIGGPNPSSSSGVQAASPNARRAPSFLPTFH